MSKVFIACNIFQTSFLKKNKYFSTDFFLPFGGNIITLLFAEFISKCHFLPYSDRLFNKDCILLGLSETITKPSAYNKCLIVYPPILIPWLSLKIHAYLINIDWTTLGWLFHLEKCHMYYRVQSPIYLAILLVHVTWRTCSEWLLITYYQTLSL